MLEKQNSAHSGVVDGKENGMGKFLVLGIIFGVSGMVHGVHLLSDSSQASEHKSKISETPLNADQIAIYRAVLTDYVKNFKGSLNVADTTYALSSSDSLGPDERCLKGIKLEPVDKSAKVVHRLDRAVALSANMKLVTADEQQKMISANDPQITIKAAGEGDGKLTDKQIEDSVKHAFETGLFSFSEIGFDRQHRNAVVEYGFACGMLCGNGNTLLLRKSGDKWKIRKRCGGWIS